MTTEYLSPGQVGIKERVSAQTVRNWIKWQWLQADIVVNGRLLISEESLEAFKKRRHNKKAITEGALAA